MTTRLATQTSVSANVGLHFLFLFFIKVGVIFLFLVIEADSELEANRQISVSGKWQQGMETREGPQSAYTRPALTSREAE